MHSRHKQFRPSYKHDAYSAALFLKRLKTFTDYFLVTIFRSKILFGDFLSVKNNVFLNSNIVNMFFI